MTALEIRKMEKLSNSDRMSNSNLIIFYLLSATMIMFFTACEEKDKPTDENSLIVIEDPTSDNPFVIIARNADTGGEEITTVKVSMSSNADFTKVIEFSAKYENNGFQLNFPATIPDEYLSPVGQRSGVQVSDIQAKTKSVDILAYKNTERPLGIFNFKGKEFFEVRLEYSNRSFTEKGVSNGVDYNLSYKEGWNVRYRSDRLVTTQRPFRENFKCTMEPYQIFGVL